MLYTQYSESQSEEIQFSPKVFLDMWEPPRSPHPSNGQPWLHSSELASVTLRSRYDCHTSFPDVCGQVGVVSWMSGWVPQQYILFREAFWDQDSYCKCTNVTLTFDKVLHLDTPRELKRASSEQVCCTRGAIVVQNVAIGLSICKLLILFSQVLS